MQIPHLGRRGRLALKIAGYVVLALVSFVFALQLTFPYHRVKDKLVEVLASSYDVTVGDVSRGIMPGTFTLERVTLWSRPTKADEKPSQTYFEEIEVDVGVLSLVRGVGSADFEITMGQGSVEGTVQASKERFEIQASAVGMPAVAIPQIQDVLGLPLVGKLDVNVNLVLPRNDWRQARGALTLDCRKNCTLGDGEAKFKPKVRNQRSATMMGEGIEFGHVYIDRVSARVQVDKGTLAVTKWEFESKDAELEVDLEMRLGRTLKQSEFKIACFRFRATEVLAEREPKTAAAIATTGGVLGPDNLFHIKIDGSASQVRPRGRVCSGEGADDEPGDNGPDLSVGRIPRPTLSPTGDGSAAAPPTLRDVGGSVSDINPQPEPEPQPEPQPSGAMIDAAAGAAIDAAPGTVPVAPGTVPAVPPGADNPAGVAPSAGGVTGEREVRDEVMPPQPRVEPE